MTNTFKNPGLTPVPTSSTTVYTCPGATTAIVHTLHLANIDASLSVNATISIYDASLAASRIIGNLIPITSGSAFSFPKPFNLEAGDRIDVTASNANRLSCSLAVLEIT